MRVHCFLVFLAGMHFAAFAQSDLIFDPDTAFLDLNNVNLQDTVPTFGTDIDLTWQGDSSITMSWRRINSDCQDSWEFTVGDKNITLPPGNSQASVLPLVMAPGEQSYLRVDVIHHRLAGCCTVGIEFSEEGGGVIDTCHFVFRLNSDCSGTSSVGVQATFLELDIYPNPVVDVLTIKGIQRIRSARIYDVLGNPLARFYGEHLDVGGMMPGSYYLQIRMTSGDVVTRPFIKS